MSNNPSGNNGGGIRNFFAVGEVFGYFFRKKDPSRPANINLKLMHGINRIAILMFLVSIIVFLVRKFA